MKRFQIVTTLRKSLLCSQENKQSCTYDNGIESLSNEIATVSTKPNEFIFKHYLKIRSST